MTNPLPLAAASRRLRDVQGFPARPGRPRKHPAPEPANGDNTVTAAPGPRMDRGDSGGAPARQASAQVAAAALWPRLLSVEGVCRYLSLGEDVVLELERAGLLARVRIPAPVTARRQGGEIRRVLYDREALDRAIDAWRDRP